MDIIKNIDGAQSVRRALVLLKLLASQHETGMRLSDIVVSSGLVRSTAHRLLTCLIEEGFVEKDASGKRYRLGLQAMQLGFAVMNRMPLLEKFRPIMQKLARLSGDTVFLVIRQGDEALCLHRETGSFPVKVFTIDVGERRLIGVGAGGLAMLAGLDDEEIEQIYARHQQEYLQAGLSVSQLRKAIKNTRKNGFSETVDSITHGVAGVGAAIPVGFGMQAALSFGAIASRMDVGRRRELSKILVDAIK
ncbi:IclR family transcriptional regulator [Orrella sp. NBD-18]|uniref:IclR family transcriptional regulator n=1 Tax=Sheuella amnicola TaxID=2707330 RepID=A0A6B2QZ69_9BURK|nr:IclR family transcriptional regulator [Sheuella amnicola]NDY82057.1 IclR family transcriptional regulator [Sheuella amnicola]HBI84219.1 IclR family transcriptional regulator [Alcaligenaceae bacterium]